MLELWYFSENTFPWVPTFWPYDLYHGFLPKFWKLAVTFCITFQLWILDLSYFTWTFLVIRSSFWWTFWPWHLTNFLKKLLNNKILELSYYTWALISCDEIYSLVLRYLIVLVTLVIFEIGHHLGHLCIIYHYLN